MKEIRVVHCRKEPFDVYIGRGSKWGNPFVIGKDGSRVKVIQKYTESIINNPSLVRSFEELEGKTLGCWCKPGLCHGDILKVLVENISDCLWCGERHFGGPEYCLK